MVSDLVGNQAKMARSRKQEYAGMDKSNSDLEKKITRQLSRLKLSDSSAQGLLALMVLVCVALTDSFVLAPVEFVQEASVQRKLVNIISATANYRSEYQFSAGSLACAIVLLYVFRSETDTFYAFQSLNTKIGKHAVSRGSTIFLHTFVV